MDRRSQQPGPHATGDADESLGRDGAEPRAMLLCTACDPAQGCRIGIAPEIAWTPQRLHCSAVCPATERGAPTVAQGGWIAKVFDEVLAQLPIRLGRGGVTRELCVQYRRPVPIERELVVEGWLAGDDGRDTTVAGEMRLAATGAVLATARATFVDVGPDHGRRHEEWLAGQDAQTGAPPDATSG